MKRFFTGAFFLPCLIQFLTVSILAQESSSIRNSNFVFDAPAMLFISVEPFEIRIEIMVKGIPLLEVLDFPTADRETIPVAEQEPIKSRALEFFGNRFSLLLDGIASQPDSARANFLKIGDENSVIKERVTDEPLDAAVVGLSFVYPVDMVPAYFQLALAELPEAINRMPAQVRVQDTVQEFEFSRYLLTFDWSSRAIEFQLPDIQPVEVTRINFLGRPMLDKPEAADVIRRLIENIYLAFEYPHESTVYDKLALSIGGEQLSSIYLEQRQRMEAVNRGGARVKILEVRMEEIEDLSWSGDDYRISGQWEVAGKVTHFGHTHERRNRYRANLTLSSVDKHWKILEIEVLEESRIQ